MATSADHRLDTMEIKRGVGVEHDVGSSWQSLSGDALRIVAENFRRPSYVLNIMLCSKEMHQLTQSLIYTADVVFDSETLGHTARRSGWGPTALTWAIKNGRTSIAQRAINAAVQLEDKDYIDGISRRSVLKMAMAPIHIAVLEGNLAVCRMLIQAGCNINMLLRPSDLSQIFQPPHPRVAPLGRPTPACDPGAHPKCGASTELSECTTPLALACAKGREKTVRLLVSNGAFVCDWGVMPLHAAAANGRLHIVKLLLQYEGVDVNYTSMLTRCSALHAAVNIGTDTNAEMIRLLVAEGADVEAHDDNHATPLLIAVLRFDRQHAETLLELGASTARLTDQQFRWLKKRV